MNDATATREKRAFAARLKEARIGDPAAQYDVALMYANGVGVSKNVVQAFNWTKNAAQKGHAPAQYLLGSAFLAGLGTSKDEREALVWFLRSHEHGNEKGTLKLARLLSTAQPAAAFLFATEAAEKGLSDAQCMVADCLMKGWGVAVDAEQSLVWYERAAQGGSAAAQYAMGQWCAGRADEGGNAWNAVHWYRLAAKQGHPGAQLELDRIDLADQGRDTNRGNKEQLGGRERRASESRLTKFAGNGRAEDAYHMGLVYDLGHSVERNLRQVRAWFRKAAELGEPRAQYALATTMEQNDPLQVDGWLRLAALQGHGQAQHVLGERLVQRCEPDGGQALHWLSCAAVQGLAPSQWALARYLKDHCEESIYRNTVSAAHGGVADAQFELGERFRQGVGVTQSWFEACQWYLLAAQQGHAQAQCELAGCLLMGRGVKKDTVQAFVWYEKAAALKLPQAQWNLGKLYAVGLPGVPKDSKRAAMLCKRAANAGYAPAQATLGSLFSQAKKHDRAVHWWTLAAQQGDLEAQYNLALAWRLGLGVVSDEAKAFDWLLNAAEGGLALAQLKLGLAYATGEGAALDLVEAAKWFELAAMTGNSAAAANWAHAKQKLGVAHQIEAQRRARSWQRQRN